MFSLKDLQKALSPVRRAVENYGMIRPGDRVAVGLSGGKDSIALLYILNGLRRFDDFSFELCAVTADPCFGDVKSKTIAPADYSPLTEFCNRLGVSHTVVKTDIARIVFDEREEDNPCSLCAKLRRGALVNAAEALGCNVLALGHHMDDAASTFLLNLLYGGRIGCFSPVTEYEKVRLIRPMIYLREREIPSFVAHNSLPVLPRACPEDGETERERMNALAEALGKEYGPVRERIVGALERGEIDGWSRKSE